MSVADEILRLQQAKSDLATSITNKGVTVPAATTIDGYAALVDQIQTGGAPPMSYDAEIEYLGFSGTQFIDLSYWNGVNITISVKVSLNAASNSEQDILSNQCVTSGTARRFVCCVHNNKFCIVTRNNNTGNNLYYTSNYAANTFYNVTFQLTPNTGRSITVNGNKVSDANLSYKVDNLSSRMRIGAGYGGDHVTALWMSGKIASVSITGDGVLLYDMVAVRRNGIGYMYDKVTKQLFGNDGTGSFVLGPDVT